MVVAGKDMHDAIIITAQTCSVAIPRLHVRSPAKKFEHSPNYSGACEDFLPLVSVFQVQFRRTWTAGILLV